MLMNFEGFMANIKFRSICLNIFRYISVIGAIVRFKCHLLNPFKEILQKIFCHFVGSLLTPSHQIICNLQRGFKEIFEQFHLTFAHQPSINPENISLTN